MGEFSLKEKERNKIIYLTLPLTREYLTLELNEIKRLSFHVGLTAPDMKQNMLTIL